MQELYHHVGDHLETWLPLPARHHVASDVESVEQVRLPSVVSRDYEVCSDVVLPGMLGQLGRLVMKYSVLKVSRSPPQILVSQMSHPRLHFIFLFKMVQSGLGDVNPPDD